jgi:4-hydroxy-tetrahydrodipicolinate synthase
MKQQMSKWPDVFLGTLLPMVPVPYDEQGQPDLSAVESLAGWMKTQPVDGVALFADSFGGMGLDRDRRLEILRRWREAMEGLHLIVAVGPGDSTSRKSRLSSAVKAAKDAAEFADFLLVRPIGGSGKSSTSADGAVEYHRALAETGVPLITISAAAGDGSAYGGEVLDAVLEMPEVAAVRTGMNCSSMQMQDLITHTLIAHPDKAILSGEDRMYGYSLYRGCHGALTAIGSICPNLQRELVDSWFMSEAGRFLNLSRLIDHIAEAVFVEPLTGLSQRILIALAHQGIIPDTATHDPTAPPISPKEEELVRATLDALWEWCDVKS